MSWERTSIATFRGVEFFVGTAERSGGRRTVVHEFPHRDRPFVEDLGRRARTFPVDGYVVGEDYQQARDALTAALEAHGPGELVHPYHGTFRVAVREFRVRESSSEGGIAYFSIDFVETEARPPAPTAAPNAADRLRASAELARAGVREEFLAAYQQTSLVDSAANMLRAATLRVNNVRSSIGRTAQQVATMQRRIDELLSSVQALVRAPSLLWAALVSLFDSLTAREAVAAYDFDPGQRPPATTSSRRVEQGNFDALQAAIQRVAIIRAAEASTEEVYDSYETAVEARETIVMRLDHQVETASAESFPAILQLRADLTRAVPPPGADLPHLMKVTPPQTTPSLALAYQLYGTTALDVLERDLVRRNHIAHPGFLRGGVTLEVLSRG